MTPSPRTARAIDELRRLMIEHDVTGAVVVGDERGAWWFVRYPKDTPVAVVDDALVPRGEVHDTPTTRAVTNMGHGLTGCEDAVARTNQALHERMGPVDRRTHDAATSPSDIDARAGRL